MSVASLSASVSLPARQAEARKPSGMDDYRKIEFHRAPKPESIEEHLTRFHTAHDDTTFNQLLGRMGALKERTGGIITHYGQGTVTAEQTAGYRREIREMGQQVENLKRAADFVNLLVTEMAAGIEYLERPVFTKKDLGDDAALDAAHAATARKTQEAAARVKGVISGLYGPLKALNTQLNTRYPLLAYSVQEATQAAAAGASISWSQRAANFAAWNVSTPSITAKSIAEAFEATEKAEALAKEASKPKPAQKEEKKDEKKLEKKESEGAARE